VQEYVLIFVCLGCSPHTPCGRAGVCQRLPLKQYMPYSLVREGSPKLVLDLVVPFIFLEDGKEKTILVVVLYLLFAYCSAW
jgi:hypothetical protein